jgi:integrase
MNAALHAFDPAALPAAGEPTIAAIVEAYLVDQVTELTPDAYAERARLGRLFAAEFGSATPGRIRPSLVKAWILGRPEWKRASTRKGILQAVKRLFNWAVDDRWIGSNPLKGLSLPCGDGRRATSEAELQAMLRHSGAELRRLLVFLRATGARPGEAAALDWEWIHWDLHVAVIPKGSHKTGKKTGKGREVPLPAVAYRLLAWLRRRVLIDSGPVFVNSRGRRWTGSALGQRLTAIRAAGGLPAEATFHGLRHLFGTCGVKRGNLKLVSKAMGHAKAATTETFYCHLDLDPALLEQAELAAVRYPRGVRA